MCLDVLLEEWARDKNLSYKTVALMSPNTKALALTDLSADRLFRKWWYLAAGHTQYNACRRFLFCWTCAVRCNVDQKRLKVKMNLYFILTNPQCHSEIICNKMQLNLLFAVLNLHLVGLSLGKKIVWHTRNYVCYVLGLLGIKRRRDKPKG